MNCTCGANSITPFSVSLAEEGVVLETFGFVLCPPEAFRTLAAVAGAEVVLKAVRSGHYVAVLRKVREGVEIALANDAESATCRLFVDLGAGVREVVELTLVTYIAFDLSTPAA